MTTDSPVITAQELRESAPTSKPRTPRVAIEDIHTRVTFEENGLAPDEMESCIQTLTGDILAWDTETECDVVIGTVSGYYLDVARVHNISADLHDVLDIDGDTYDAVDLFDCDDDSIDDRIHDLFGGNYGSNVLLISTLDIQAPFRGKNFEFAALHRLMRQTQSMAHYVAVRPSSLHQAVDGMDALPSELQCELYRLMPNDLAIRKAHKMGLVLDEKSGFLLRSNALLQSSFDKAMKAVDALDRPYRKRLKAMAVAKKAAAVTGARRKKAAASP